MLTFLRRLFWDAPLTQLPPFTVHKTLAVPDLQYNKEIIDWGLSSLGIPDIWKETQGEGVKVAILDTGISLEHPDLKDSIIMTKDFTGQGVEDLQGHGSHCAGIVAARMNNLGVVGVAPKAQIMVGKVLSNEGYGDIDWVVKGMKWALKNGADIISMSLGSNQGDIGLKRMCEKIIKSGTILICAAGNDGEGSDTIGYPGHYEGVICVGSTNRDRERSSYSSTGKSLDIMAPGEQVLSCYVGKKYARLSGTSMATPFVAGVCALILSKHRNHGGDTPCENQEQMIEHLTKVAKDIEYPGFDENTGWGLIQPGKSVGHEDEREG